jgi:hypothetical protein
MSKTFPSRQEPSRRDLLRAAAGSLGVLAGDSVAAAAEQAWQLALFTAEVTCPVGHPLMGGGIAPAQKIDDPLFAHGLVLQGGEQPIVLVTIDWCEIRNDAYDRWRTVLADAAAIRPAHVLVTSVHQHDAPIADLEAQRLLDHQKAAGRICDAPFHEQAVQRVAQALRSRLKAPRRVTHLGLGQARVEQVASNRRFLGPDGRPHFSRTSATRDHQVRAQPEGTIDARLKTLSFWDGDRPLAAVSAYATHPMSYYGRGGVSADFVGLARRRRQADAPQVAQLYVSGCSGNVTAGKYNDGSPANRPVLAERLYRAMVTAWEKSQRHPFRSCAFRSASLRLEPRNSPGFTVADLRRRLASDPKPFGQCLAALGLSWRKRADAGHTIDVPVLDFGSAQLLLMPAESYVEYQLAAQKLRPDTFVLVAGYGECAPGYVPTERAFQEDDSNLHDWCWVAPGAERAMTTALEAVLKKR